MPSAVSSISPVQLLKARAVLTDAQIKTLPTTPVVMVPATETLNYSGLPSQLPIPIATVVRANGWTTGYTNLTAGDDANRFGLAWSSDAGGPKASGSVFNTDLAETFGSFYLLGGTVAKGLANGNLIESALLSMLGGILDNALIFFSHNSDGNFTGGHADNTLTVEVVYVLWNA